MWPVGSRRRLTESGRWPLVQRVDEGRLDGSGDSGAGGSPERGSLPVAEAVGRRAGHGAARPVLAATAQPTTAANPSGGTGPAGYGRSASWDRTGWPV